MAASQNLGEAGGRLSPHPSTPPVSTARQSLPAPDLVTSLRRAAQASGDRGIVFVSRRGDTRVSYAELWERALARAGGLAALGLGPGRAVVLVLDTGPDLVELILGALVLGALPVCVGPPTGFQTLEAFGGKLFGTVRSVDAGLVIVGDRLRSELPTNSGLRVVSPSDVRPGLPPEPHRPHPSDVAFIQLTSGTTAQPRACAMSHGAVVTNMRRIAADIDLDPASDKLCSWLPFHHDMGLSVLHYGVLWGLDFVLLKPGDFLRRPASWFQAISRHRASLAPAPTFAYTYCTRRIRDRDLEGVDLSCWRNAWVGAEPVHPGALRGFTERFAPLGFSDTTFLPCYGMAETTLAVTFKPHTEPFRTVRASRDALGRAGRLAPPSSEVEDAVELVSCGRPLPDITLDIVGNDGDSLPTGHVGEVVVDSPCLFSEYRGDPEATARALRGGRLFTGDVGFLDDRGELFVTGRLKDLIIIHGKNLAPAEVEWIVGAVPGIEPDAVAAFGISDPSTGEEGLGILAGTKRSEPAERSALEENVRASVRSHLGLGVAQLHLVPRRTIPKTSSGKVRRKAAQQIAVELVGATS